MARHATTHDRNMTPASEQAPLLVEGGKPKNGQDEGPPSCDIGTLTALAATAVALTSEPKREKASQTKDAELKAMAQIVRILDALPGDASRRRVVCYVSDRWADERDAGGALSL